MTATAAEPSTATALDRAVSALCEADSNLDNVAAVLRELGKDEHADDAPTAGRVRALCWFLAKQLSERWDAETRSAPPVALAEVVLDAAVPCRGPRCSENVLPWQFDGVHCCADCRNDAMAEDGVSMQDALR